MEKGERNVGSSLRIYSQLWALGRAAYPTRLALDYLSLPSVSASDVKSSEGQLGHKGADTINPRVVFLLLIGYHAGDDTEDQD